MKKKPLPALQSGFTLLEMLVVITLMTLIGSLMAMKVLSNRMPGVRYGTNLQLIQAFDEARMNAIETGAKIYLGFAGSDNPDPNKRLCAYVLFRDYTAAELSQMSAPPPAGTYVQINEWKYLSQGYYYDPTTSSSLLSDGGSVMSFTNGSSESCNVYAVTFGGLGEVLSPPPPANTSSAPMLVIREGQYDSNLNQLTPAPGGDASAFYVTVNRLTGRGYWTDGLPTDNSGASAAVATSH